MRLLHLPFFVASLAVISNANAATIGVVAPQTGPYAILGDQIRNGAKAALENQGHQILEVNETCEPESGTSIAEALVNGKANFAIGFLCTESLIGGIEFLAASNIPALTLSSRASGLAEDAIKYNWPLFRIAPSLSDEAQAVTDSIIAHWKGAAISLVDDGTIYSRELIDAVRLQLENLGLKPSFVDTLRPGQENQLALVRRLKRLNIAHLFVSADRSDVAIIARDAKSDNVPLSVMSGEAMKGPDHPVPLSSGTLAVIEPDYKTLPSAAAAVKSIEASGKIVEGYVLPAYGAMQIVQAVAKRASDESKAPIDVLNSSSFDTVLGPIRFNEQKGLTANPFKLQQWNGEAFVDPSNL